MVELYWPALAIPEEHGGVGADALATCIVIEEVARGCASASLIPAVNKLGTMGLILSGSEELKQRFLPAICRGELTFSIGMSEPDAGSDLASLATHGPELAAALTNERGPEG